MPLLYHGTQYISYAHYKIHNKEAPLVIFVHGLLSNKKGKKSIFIKDYCVKNNYNYIAFDNFGHGESSGSFLHENISSWLTGLELIIKKLGNKKIFIVGSSMGGWLTLLLASNKLYHNIIKGIITLAAAPDFTETLIWEKLTNTQKEEMQAIGMINLEIKDNECINIYPIKFSTIIDGRKHLMMHNTINIICPTHIIHGMKDHEVPYNVAKNLVKKIKSDEIVLKLIKKGKHNLSTPENLKIIESSLNELISY